MSESGLNMSRRIRRTPYTDKVEQHGVRGFSVVNHMLLPKAFALRYLSATTAKVLKASAASPPASWA